MVMEKLKFWKKNEEELPEGPLEEDLPSEENAQDLSMPKFERKTPKFAEPFLKQEEPEAENKDIRLVLEKLDTIKAMLESLSHRVEKIERLAER